MDFKLDNYPSSADNQSRQVIILACKSRQYYCEPLENTGAKPLLLTTGLMAAFKKQTDFAIGNILGSNIYNVLGILGITSLMQDLKMPILNRNIEINTESK